MKFGGNSVSADLCSLFEFGHFPLYQEFEAQLTETIYGSVQLLGSRSCRDRDHSCLVHSVKHIAWPMEGNPEFIA